MRDLVQVRLNEQAALIKDLRKQLGDLLDQNAMLAIALRSVQPYVQAKAETRAEDPTFERASGLMDRALDTYAAAKR